MADLSLTALRQCQAVLFSEELCPSIQRDIETFLAANRSCETAADCMVLDNDVGECAFTPVCNEGQCAAQR